MTEPHRTSPLRAGEIVPEFSGTTDSGSTISRADLLGRPTILYFYPKAGSPGCSAESREFARLHADFEAAGVRVIGVSVDSREAQHRFRDDCHLPFDLVSDEGQEISRAFGVLGALGMARRTTFLIGPDGKVLEVIRTFRPRRHVDVARERLLQLSEAPGAPPPHTETGRP